MKKPSREIDIHELVNRLDHSKAIAGASKWQRHSQEFSDWLQDALLTLRQVDPEFERSFNQIPFSPTVVNPLMTNEVWEAAFRSGITQAIRLIDVALSELKSTQIRQEREAPKNDGPEKTRSKRGVFIGHGRELTCLQAVENFVIKIGFDPVVLKDQGSGGLVLLDKLEASANVDFAIILLTPDDLGRLKDETELNPRARQNVIFEFGYLIAKLGRHRVCTVMKDMVEMPSNVLGLVHIPYDPEGIWRFKILKEMTTGGLKVDANNAL